MIVQGENQCRWDLQKTRRDGAPKNCNKCSAVSAQNTPKCEHTYKKLPYITYFKRISQYHMYANAYTKVPYARVCTFCRLFFGAFLCERAWSTQRITHTCTHTTKKHPQTILAYGICIVNPSNVWLRVVGDNGCSSNTIMRGSCAPETYAMALDIDRQKAWLITAVFRRFGRRRRRSQHRAIALHIRTDRRRWPQ